MPQFLGWIIREIVVAGLFSIIFAPTESTVFQPVSPDKYTQEQSEDWIDYNDPDLLNIEPEAYLSSYFLSETPIQFSDLRGSFTGVINDEIYTIVMYPDDGAALDTFYFAYYALNMKTKMSTQAKEGVVIASQNRIVMNWRGDNPIEGEIYKVDNITENVTYIFFGIVSENEKFAFFNTLQQPKFSRP